MQSFIYSEPSAEGIGSLTRQIVSGVKKIPVALRGQVKGISIGSGMDGREELAKGVFDELIRVEVPSGIEFSTEAIANILVSLAQDNAPALLFFGYTHQGMELAPAIGWRLKIPVVTNCTGFAWTGGNTAHIKRPLQGGKLILTLEAPMERGAVISVQKGAWKENGQSGREEEQFSVRQLPWQEMWKPEKTALIGICADSVEGEEDITKADILVSVGRGLGDPEHLPMMRELAEKVGAMLSCSRPVVDLGWLPAIRQVGISGRTVAPVIYLALGISGQANHLAGMDASRIIIAVNKDPAAPIFGVAKYGIVDDILEFVPELLTQIAARQSC